MRHIRRLWGAYEDLLTRRPFLTNTITAAAITTTGDYCAQRIEFASKSTALEDTPENNSKGQEGKAFELDVGRTATMFGWGVLALGGPSYLYYRYVLDGIFGNAKRLPTILAKIAFNQSLFATSINALFFAYIKAIEHRDSSWQDYKGAVKTKLYDDFGPTMFRSTCLWPAAHLINFYLVPPRLRVMYVNMISTSWMCYMSMVGFKDKPVDAVTQNLVESVVVEGPVRTATNSSVVITQK